MRKLEILPFYPPRARWYGRWRQIGDGFRRVSQMDWICLPENISLWQFLAALLIPGLAFWLRRQRRIGQAIMAAWALLLAVFILWLGYTVANFAFSLMLSLHATSILFLISPWLRGARLFFRLLAGVATLFLLGALLYVPLRNQLQNRWLLPMRVQGQVVVVQTFSLPSVRRGDWVAYRIDEDSIPGLRLPDSLGLRPVIGLPGDRIRFTPTACVVNGFALPRQPRMPDSGELIVEENHWFIWPELAIIQRGAIADSAIDAVFLRTSNVEQSQYVGKPLRRWFWRKQHLP